MHFTESENTEIEECDDICTPDTIRRIVSELEIEKVKLLHSIFFILFYSVFYLH